MAVMMMMMMVVLVIYDAAYDADDDEVSCIARTPTRTPSARYLGN